MDGLVNTFNRKMKARRIITKILVFVLLLISVICMCAFVVTAATKDRLIILFGILTFAIPVLCVVVFVESQRIKERMIKNLKEDLVKANFSADELMDIGDRTNVNLFDLALTVRCKELGMSHPPVWCIHDGVLPTHR